MPTPAAGISNAEFCHAHARVKVEPNREVGLKVYDDREVRAQADRGIAERVIDFGTRPCTPVHVELPANPIEGWHRESGVRPRLRSRSRAVRVAAREL
jgi:hypothetical protein